ncbi:DUF262 domain-containing protein [Tenuifilum sp.]|uniref:DUF262 domain-containing protein n=1 Tax=Tenuifilum sp. TaxID=2760880 RepID=UPI001B4688C3|nr:DUF262 domain-containing protein [Bacteroidales bacterium]HOK85747.1 DUF262 domain-containing protein [Tenuifilum sp.]HON70591.1 DUF262 domain-containing protein [Tenuifilum sp.]HQE54833.1 DUF262 domain-containing protein [Tenuifilum sp.]HRU86591.1 DUF262 domain-containing protein [Tenuifilum sp.]
MSCLTEKTIGEILENKFFIPSYQRGYRWTERQVEDLLNDVWDFITKTGKKDNEWYCLQPVVVKKTNNHYEVLDGQQRLTTIFLILKHLERFIESEKKSFEIEYETRNTESSNSKLFLQSIDLKSEKESKENIDYFHIFQAYQKIKEWFQTKANQGYNSISSKFVTPFLESTKVIWYEVSSEKDAIEIFTRINMGKIPLTNAELIKALFLNSSNFPDSDTEEIRLRQLEIASEWDRMEYSLQNDEFWYFINNSDNELPTRIEFLFNIMKNIDGVKNGNDQYSTFRFFSEKFKSKSKDEIDANWKEIKRIFQTIEEWFTDRELYHKIGFLISANSDITELLKEVKNKQKQEFRKLLDIKIAEKVKCENLEELEYGKHSDLIRKILLLHNIQTMLNNKNETIRFPFERYKKEKWDIEHIHAIATKVKVKFEDQNTWLFYNFVKTEQHTNLELNSQIENAIKGNQIAEDDFQSIVEYVLGDDDNTIRNLCLLDRGTNRSYKNDSFKNKRNKIIENEKNGTFIPVCTRNVFMKYYSKELKDLEIWNENDRADYLDDLKRVVYNFKSQVL